MSIDSPEVANGEQGVIENAASFHAVADHATLHASLGPRSNLPVLLNFLGLSWPHVTVATLKKTF